MTTDLFLLAGSAVALFLAGVNVAFLLLLGGKIVGWFKFKVFAISLLLVYIAMSFSWGSPAPSRVYVGWTALVIDLVAICWMWYGIEVARKSGTVGLVPLIAKQINPKS